MRLNKLDENIFWSDNWWIEGKNAWFIPGEENILLKANFEKREISLVHELPIKNKIGFRLYPRCVKSGRYVFCLPTYEKDVFRYDCKNKVWMKIPLNCGNEKRVIVVDFTVYDKKLYLISKGLSKIFIIDIDKAVVLNEVQIGNKDEVIGRSIFTNDYIYISSSISSVIYEFEISKNKVNKLYINELNDDINTLCFDDKIFWISGHKRAIYAWERNNNKLKKFDDFPYDFGEYNFSGVYDNLLNIDPEKYIYPVFLESVSVGEFVWFIPYKTNKILYINKESNRIKEFVVDEKIDNKESLQRHIMLAMYLLLYVRKERYIGIYSLKNETIIEIDSEQMNYKVQKFDFQENILKLFLNKVFIENRKFDLRIYRSLIGESLNETKYNNVGDLIYQMIKNKG